MSFDADIVIAGGGPVGACAGALLARSAKVILLEPAPPVSASDPSDVPRPQRVAAISRASERILAAAGAWDDILARGASPYERMQVWHESTPHDGFTKLRFDAADAGEPNLGWIIANAGIQQALLDAFVANGGQIERGTLTAARFSSDAVEIDTPGQTLRARLLIGADGARSAVREIAGIPAAISTYRQTAIVATVASERPHESTAWQRFMTTGTLAFLPFTDGTSSIVWSIDDAAAERLMALETRAFESELARTSDGVLGALTLASARASFALQRLAATRYVTERCALIGDAAHVIHPLAGQGINLGFLDAASLAQVLRTGPRHEDPGALGTLRRYERWRRSENRLMDLAIDAFNRFLAHGTGPVSGIARRGLGWVDRSPQLKQLFVRYALGLDGDLPAVARRRSRDFDSAFAR